MTKMLTRKYDNKELLLELHQAQENEHQRIAVEIHGGVVQWLVAADYGIQMCRSLIADARYEELEASLMTIKETVRSSIQELRRVITNSRPRALEELGLVGALSQSSEIVRKKGIDCRFAVRGKTRKLDTSVEGALYWAGQEMLTNICKHACASKVNMHLHYSSGAVSIKAIDNGLGFNVDEVMNNAISSGRMGLISMKDRMELLGGGMVIDSSLRQGTTVCVSLPVLN